MSRKRHTKSGSNPRTRPRYHGDGSRVVLRLFPAMRLTPEFIPATRYRGWKVTTNHRRCNTMTNDFPHSWLESNGCVPLPIAWPIGPAKAGLGRLCVPRTAPPMSRRSAFQRNHFAAQPRHRARAELLEHGRGGERTERRRHRRLTIRPQVRAAAPGRRFRPCRHTDSRRLARARRECASSSRSAIVLERRPRRAHPGERGANA
jgi:hypothetical protein